MRDIQILCNVLPDETFPPLGEKWGGSTTLHFNGLILVYSLQQSTRSTFLPVPQCLMFLIRQCCKGYLYKQSGRRRSLTTVWGRSPTRIYTQCRLLKCSHLSTKVQIFTQPLSVTNCFWCCIVANSFKIKTKQLFGDILCSSLNLLSVINNKQGFNVVVDSPRQFSPLFPFSLQGNSWDSILNLISYIMA